MSVPAAFGFGLAVLPVCLTPGVSFTLVTQRVLSGGRRAGVRVAIGTAFGLTCHALLAAVGLAALVMRSAEAFTAVKIAGAVYLGYLGLTMLWRARGSAPETTGRRLPWTVRGDVLQGFLGNVLNSKAAAVYLTLAPQFLHRGDPVLPQMAALVAAHITVALTWLFVWSAIVDSARAALATARARRVVDRITGSVMLGFGVRTAAAAR